MTDHSGSFVSMDLDWNYFQWNIFFSERHRLVYIATPKVACTSLKWWFARLEGVSKEIREITDSVESEKELVIHDSFHKVAPEVTVLPRETLEILIKDNSYFKFAVVRNPYKRIFSAWQSKILLREPYQAALFSKESFFHFPIGGIEDLRAAFENFLEHVYAKEMPSFWDVHWTPQSRLLRPDVIKYSAIGQIENYSIVAASLAAHLGSDILSPFDVHSSNESLIPFLPELLTQRSAALIRLIYAEDFEIFGYDTGVPEAKEHFSKGRLDIALKAAAMIRGRHERMTEMRALANERFRVALADEARIVGLELELSEYRKQAEKFQQLLMDSIAHADSISKASSEDAANYRRQIAALVSQMYQLEQANSVLGTDVAESRAHLGHLTGQLDVLQSELREQLRNLSSTRYVFRCLMALLRRNVWRR